MFWTLYFNGSKYNDGVGAGCILVNPDRETNMLAYKLGFDCTNNIVEYEALVQGLQKAISLTVRYLKMFGDSEIVIKQVINNIHCVSNHLKHYQYLIQDLISHFSAFNIAPIPRLHNASANILAHISSKLIPPEDFSSDRFLIELIFYPSILDNITNWHMINDENDILSFLTSEGSYSDQIFDEDEHDKKLNKYYEDNSLPKPLVRLEDLYDLKDRFKKVTNYKFQSSTLIFELVNLGSDHKPHNINLGLGIAPDERSSFINILTRYKDVFSWSYDDTKTYDTSIIQHTIPMLLDVNPIQQKLRKIHPNLEAQIKIKLNKILKAKIIFQSQILFQLGKKMEIFIFS